MRADVFFAPSLMLPTDVTNRVVAGRGRLRPRDTQTEVNDAAQAAMVLNKKYGTNLKRLFKASWHGQALAAAGFEADLEACAELNAYGVLPVYQDRQITKLAAERSR